MDFYFLNILLVHNLFILIKSAHNMLINYSVYNSPKSITIFNIIYRELCNYSYGEKHLLIL